MILDSGLLFCSTLYIMHGYCWCCHLNNQHTSSCRERAHTVYNLYSTEQFVTRSKFPRFRHKSTGWPKSKPLPYYQWLV